MSLPLAASADDPVHWTLIEARGEDARTFLQGQLSCDVLSLSLGHCVHGLLLTPSGEVITSLRCDFHPEGVDIVVRSEVVNQTLAALRRFLLRTKCELREAGEVPGDYVTIGRQVELGEPGPAEFAKGVAAHTFGQGFVDRHVSFTKGCFTGQELVGRLDVRGGNVPFHLARVTGDSIDHMDVVVRSAGPSGERGLQGLTTVYDRDGPRGLALVHRTLLGDEQRGTVMDVAVELLHD
jgi:folate-binding Fe-S cluster repair protein YgfZ